MAGFRNARTAFIAIQLIVFTITAILLIVTGSVSKSVYLSNQKTMDAVSQTESLVNRLNALAASDKGKEYAALAQKLSEDLRFSDISSTVLSDKEIDRAISEIGLEYAKEITAQSSEFINLKFSEINSLITRRKIEITSFKRGTI